MVSFLIALAALIAGYFFYGRFVEHYFGPDERQTPAYAVNDGIDYVPMPLWKVFLIQLLNIAGTGPIFGALSGALFGPVVYLWIVFGCIFAGGVHDYLCGMLSVRKQGASVSELVGIYMGNGMKTLMRVFSTVLLVMIGVVFTTGPAGLLDLLTLERFGTEFWLWIILAYYFLAAFVPIDKIIGKLYPIFGICLLIMAFGVGGSLLFSGRFEMPELWMHMADRHPDGLPVWPFMFISVACGAISGFHATQSPMMARCIRSEREGRKVFYGAMICEGIIALIWAAAGVSCYDSAQALMEAGGGCSAVVYEVCTSTLGKVGSMLALLGVVICPISSGDTAYRSARLTIADWFGIDQADIKKRLLLTLPLLIAGAIICHVDYQTVWRYSAWANQTLAMIVLWTASSYFRRNGKRPWLTVIPATFMTAVTVTYFLSAPECLGAIADAVGAPMNVYYYVCVFVGAIAAAAALKVFIRRYKKQQPLAVNN